MQDLVRLELLGITFIRFHFLVFGSGLSWIAA